MGFSLDAGLAGRKIIVTGAGGGIGGAVTRLATEAGIDVVATDVDHDRLRVTVEAIEGLTTKPMQLQYRYLTESVPTTPPSRDPTAIG